jgi:signal transduction histidine kinase
MTTPQDPSSSDALPAFDASQVQFLRTMGHDLRTPLNSIISTSEMMLQDILGELEPRQVTAVQRIYRNGERLQALIDAVITYIYASSNKLVLGYDPVSPQALMEIVRKKHSSATVERETTLSLAIVDGLPTTVYGDATQLSRILDELITNAFIATSKGEIRVQLEPLDAKNWQMSVVDTGIGIAPELQTDIFQPFSRSAEFKKRNQTGHGLGLSIVHELVRMMTGTLTVQSTPNVGSSVFVRLPLNMPEYPTKLAHE